MSKVKNSRFFHLYLSLGSILLLWLGWPTKPLPFLLFLGFVPLLFTEHDLSSRNLSNKGKRFFRHSFITLLGWNAFTTYWVLFSTIPGGIAAIVLNSLLMSMPLMAYYFTKKIVGKGIGYASFVIYWLAFEYLHLSWDLTWPWLTLGNGFASQRNWVQWYEYTGFMGGSLWILVVNLAIFWALVSSSKNLIKRIAIPFTLIVLPLAISFLILNNFEEKGNDIEVVIVQPNIDPYNEKFPGSRNYIPFENQLERLITLSEAKITENTKFLVWPETALSQGFWEENLKDYPIIQQLQRFVEKHKNLDLVTGLDTYRSYPDKETASSTFRFREDIGFYDVFNAALQLNANGEATIYHKSRLVPGVEKLPYPEVFQFLGPLAIDLGGTVGSLGSQKERTVFFSKNYNTQIGVAPVICYESVYGDFVSEYVRKGANLIFIITNDGWWKDSPGYKQHLQYGALRAIENRRSIARSANTGISAFINQKGEIIENSKWWEPTSLNSSLKANSELTFYSRTGELIGTGSTWIAIFLLAFTSVKRLTISKKRS